MSQYTGDNIRVASDIDQIRDNIHLFAGEKGDQNPNHLLYEVIHNSIDEILNGYADTLQIIIDSKKDLIQVRDNGRGIPVDKKEGMYVPYIIATKLASSGKGKSQKNKGYSKPTAGLHGYGLTIVNALSEFLEIRSYRDKEYIFRLKDSNILNQEPIINDKSNNFRGTIITFKPSPKYIESTKIDLNELVYKLSAVKFSLYSNLSDKIKIDLIVDNKKIDIPDNYLEIVFNESENEFMKVTCETDLHETFNLYVAINKSQLDNLINGKSANFKNSGIINTIPISEGTHLQYGATVFKNVMYSFVQKFKYDELITKDDLLKGVRLFVDCNIIKKDFNSQDKSKLTTDINYFKKFSKIEKNFKNLLESNNIIEDFVKPFLEIIYSYKVTKGNKKLIKKQVIKDGIIKRNLKIRNLNDCLSETRDNTILFIVEGESAGGHLVRIRDVEHHAIYYLTGKPMNVNNFSISKILSNKVISDLIQAIGVGYNYRNQKVDLNNLRYDKIVILSDADPDGLHIRNLLLTFFAKMIPELIEEERIFISEQPLYKVTYKSKKYKYLYSSKELEEYKDKIVKFKRFKGLGEMEASDLKITLFDKQHSRYVKVTLSDKTDVEKFLKIM